jgi:hypothetical protein
MEGLAWLLCCGVVLVCVGVAVLKVERRTQMEGNWHCDEALTMEWPWTNIQKG